MLQLSTSDTTNSRSMANYCQAERHWLSTTCSYHLENTRIYSVHAMSPKLTETTKRPTLKQKNGSSTNCWNASLDDWKCMEYEKVRHLNIPTHVSYLYIEAFCRWCLGSRLPVGRKQNTEKKRVHCSLSYVEKKVHFMYKC